MSRTTLQRVGRLSFIESLIKKAGACTSEEVAAQWRGHARRNPSCNFVTIDSILRDLALLVKQGKLRRVRSKRAGHEWGNGRFIAYDAWESAE